MAAQKRPDIRHAIPYGLMACSDEEIIGTPEKKGACPRICMRRLCIPNSFQTMLGLTTRMRLASTPLALLDQQALRIFDGIAEVYCLSHPMPGVKALTSKPKKPKGSKSLQPWK